MYTLDRFEDAGLAVLETDTGDSLIVPRTELPADVREGDVLSKLPWYSWEGGRSLRRKPGPKRRAPP